MNSASLDPEDPLLRALAEYWDDVQRLADDEQRRFLRQLVAGTADPDPVNARAALTDLLLDVLPPDHPMVSILLATTMFRGSASGSSATEEELARSWSRLKAMVLPNGDSPESAWLTAAESAESQPATMSEFDRQVQARLLGLPFLNPDELRSRNIDPDGSGLIRLTHRDGRVQLPAFQFTGTGEPWAAVEAVNERLGAAADPWGVTCWWVDPHSGLGTAPADLLGQGRDEVLLQTAAAVGAD